MAGKIKSGKATIEVDNSEPNSVQIWMRERKKDSRGGGTHGFSYETNVVIIQRKDLRKLIFPLLGIMNEDIIKKKKC